MRQRTVAGADTKDFGQPTFTAAAAGLFALAALAAAPATLQAGDDSSIRPFTVCVPQAEVDDLRRRLAATRWPDKETVPDASQGAQLAQLQELVRYWGTGYDWRKGEAKLNHRGVPGRGPARPGGLGPSRVPEADLTSTRSTGAATSPCGSTQSCSRRSCVPLSHRFGRHAERRST